MNIKSLLLHTLILPAMTLMSSVAIAEFAYDKSSNTFYSKGASKNVDSKEYNEICHRFIQKYYPRGILDLSAAEWAINCAQLRAHGTPAALRFIHDVEEFIKAAKKDIKRINNL